MAKGVAEIALLLLLLHTGAIDKGVFSLLVLVMFGYILLTPMGISFAISDSNIPKTLLPKDRCRRRWIDSPWKESGCETSWTALEAIRSSR